MNDFGLFKALKQTIQSDDRLSLLVKGIYTHKPQDVSHPYIIYEIQETKTDAFMVQAMMRFNLKFISRYTGAKEVYSFLDGSQKILEQQDLALKPSNLMRTGHARLRLIKHDIILFKDGMTREGNSSYLARIRFTIGEL